MPPGLEAVSRCESFRTRTLAQQPQRVTRIFRFPLGGARLDEEQSYPDLPPATIILPGGRGVKAADVCA